MRLLPRVPLSVRTKRETVQASYGLLELHEPHTTQQSADAHEQRVQARLIVLDPQHKGSLPVVTRSVVHCWSDGLCPPSTYCILRSEAASADAHASGKDREARLMNRSWQNEMLSFSA